MIDEPACFVMLIQILALGFLPYFAQENIPDLPDSRFAGFS
jgi:hypothetical protein